MDRGKVTEHLISSNPLITSSANTEIADGT